MRAKEIVLSLLIATLGLATFLTAREAGADPAPPSSFGASKAYLADLHEELGHLKTLYCGCPYERTRTRSGGDLDREACGLTARKNEKRSDRLEWEHVTPASWMGRTRACWILKDEVYPECDGKSGRQCCERVNETFHLAHLDPNNLFPSGGEVNGDRAAYPFGLSTTVTESRYGACEAALFDGDNGRTFMPPERSRGTVARALLYMSTTYGVNIRYDLADLLEWHRRHPPDLWEVTRARRISEDTGLRNPWILDYTNDDDVGH